MYESYRKYEISKASILFLRELNFANSDESFYKYFLADGNFSLNFEKGYFMYIF